jgi:hypothetical protein
MKIRRPRRRCNVFKRCNVTSLHLPRQRRVPIREIVSTVTNAAQRTPRRITMSHRPTDSLLSTRRLGQWWCCYAGSSCNVGSAQGRAEVVCCVPAHRKAACSEIRFLIRSAFRRPVVIWFALRDGYLIDSQHDAPLSRGLIAQTRMAIWICAAHDRSEREASVTWGMTTHEQRFEGERCKRLVHSLWSRLDVANDEPLAPR